MAKRRLVPYEMVAPGLEAVYSDERSAVSDGTGAEEGDVVERWSLWPHWGDNRLRDSAVVVLNRMQAESGRLDESARRISAREWMDGRLEENRASGSIDSLEA
jgi:hypothetical protein